MERRKKQHSETELSFETAEIIFVRHGTISESQNDFCNKRTWFVARSHVLLLQIYIFRLEIMPPLPTLYSTVIELNFRVLSRASSYEKWIF